MFLLIDAGNTRLKLGLHDGSRWLRREAFPHAELAACGWLPLALAARPVPRVLISNVAGEAVAEPLRQLLDAAGVQVEWLRASASRCGVGNDYERPEQLGPDRWAALIGAWALQRGACLVVNAGTATTLDVLNADGRFAGGCILPGLAMMRKALAGGTAGLPLVDGKVAALPRNTADAIFNGCLHAQLGAIARMRASLPADAPVLLSGGAADLLLPWLDLPLRSEPWLVLEGLLRIVRAP